MRTIQKTLTGEVIDQVLKPIPVTEIILLPMAYLVKAVNLQRVLFLISFLTYGIGDGITAVYMMERTGIMREVNPLVRFMYATSGTHGVIVMKIWFVFIILFLAWVITKRSEAYWTVNGFLCALIVGGVMAMGANLMALYGMGAPCSGLDYNDFSLPYSAIRHARGFDGQTRYGRRASWCDSLAGLLTVEYAFGF